MTGDARRLHLAVCPWFLALVAGLLMACPELPRDDVQPSSQVVFDPIRGLIPVPNDLATVDGKVAVPTRAEDGSALYPPALMALYEGYVNGRDGFPADNDPEFLIGAALAVEDGEGLLAETLSAENLLVFDATAVLDGTGDLVLLDDWTLALSDSADPDTDTPWTRAVLGRVAPYPPGSTIAVVVTDGVKVRVGGTDLGLQSSLVVNYLKATEPLVDPETGRNHTLLPNGDVGTFEAARARIAPVLDAALTSHGIERSQVAMAWTWRVAPDSIARFDPAFMVVPTPTDLVMTPDGLLALPIDEANDSPAQVEFFTWLNTLDGFPRNAMLELGLNRPVDMATVEDGLTVWDVTDPEAPSPVDIAWSFDEERLTLTGLPAAGLWAGSGQVLVVATSDLSTVDSEGLPHPVGRAVGSALVLGSDPLVIDGASQLPGLVGDEDAAQLEEVRLLHQAWLQEAVDLGADADSVSAVWRFRTHTRNEVGFWPQLEDLDQIPFPNDVLLVLDEAQKPLGVNMGTSEDPVQGPLLDALASYDGFSLHAPVSVPVLRPVVTDDIAEVLPTNLLEVKDARIAMADISAVDPSDIATLAAPGALKFLTPDDADFTYEHGKLTITPRPGHPWRNGAHYMIVMTDAVSSAQDDGGLVPTPVFVLARLKNTLCTCADGGDYPCVDGQGRSTILGVDNASACQLEELRLAYKGIFDPLQDVIGLPRERVVQFWTFWTMDATAALQSHAQAVQAHPVMEAPSLTGTVQLADWDDSVAGYSTEGLGHIVLDGRLQSVSALPVDGDGQAYGPMAIGEETGPAFTPYLVPFVLAVPADPLTPPPYPLVIFQHGLGGSKERTFSMAGVLNSYGVAVLAIDMVLHGERTVTDDQGAALPFVSSDLVATRDQMMQASLDLVAVARTANTTLGPWLAAQLGVAGPMIDTSRITFHGLSEGGIVGSPFVAVDDTVQQALLTATSGHITRLLQTTSEPALAGLLDEILAAGGIEEGSSESAFVLHLAQWILDPVDPLSYAKRMVNRPFNVDPDDPLIPSKPAGTHERLLFQIPGADTTILPELVYANITAIGTGHVACDADGACGAGEQCLDHLSQDPCVAESAECWCHVPGAEDPLPVQVEASSMAYLDMCHQFLVAPCEGLDAGVYFNTWWQAVDDAAQFFLEGTLPEVTE